MKKLAVKIISIALAITMVFSAGLVSSQAKTGNIGIAAVDGIITGLLKGLNAIVPVPSDFADISKYSSKGFYEGTENFLSAPAQNAKWRLGYAQTSLVPSDWETKDYFLGGYIMIENGFTNRVEEVIDDMRARVIAIEDGSGRGISVFATIDSIGMTNADIRTIREKLEKLDLGVNINAITVSTTHCHSCIDTEGLWTNLIPKALGNFAKSLLHIGKLESGVDTEYMDFLTTATAQAMKSAINDMKPGTLTYAKKQLNKDYFNNKNRSSASALIDDMTRIVFTPDDTNATPTMIVSIAAHPDVAGLPTSDGQSTGRQLTGDYVYYMGDTIEKGGYNFMFFNGAIAGIYMGRGPSNDGVSFDHRYEQSARYGDEMGNIALSLTKTYEQINASADWEKINADKAESEANGGTYTLWFEDWTPVEEKPIAPVLNITFKEAKVQITNPLIMLAGKLKLANYNVYREGRSLVVFVEVGYMELGGNRIALMPGEVCQDLVEGGSSLTADRSGRAHV